MGNGTFCEIPRLKSPRNLRNLGQESHAQMLACVYDNYYYDELQGRKPDCMQQKRQDPCPEGRAVAPILGSP